MVLFEWSFLVFEPSRAQPKRSSDSSYSHSTLHSDEYLLSYHVTFSPDNGLMKEESEDWKDTDSKAVDSFLKTLLLWKGLLPLKETVAGEIFI